VWLRVVEDKWLLDAVGAVSAARWPIDRKDA